MTKTTWSMLAGALLALVLVAIYGLYASSGGADGGSAMESAPVLALLKPQTDGDDSGNPSLVARVDGLQGKIAALEKSNRDLKAELDSLSAMIMNLTANAQQGTGSAAEAFAGNDESPPLTAEDLEAMADEGEAAHEESGRIYYNVFQGENEDPEWAPSTLSTIYEQFEKPELEGTELLGADCRASICRVEVRHSNDDAETNFSLLFPLGLAEVLPQVSYHQQSNPDGSTSTVMYMAREGYELPQTRKE